MTGRHLLLELATAAAVLVGSTAAGAPWVVIMSPADGAAVMGELEVSALAGPADAVVLVELVVDGQPVASLSQPPFRFIVDLGEDNVGHTLEVVARDRDGDLATARVTTLPVPIAAEFEVDLRQLYVTVSRGGARVLGLEQESFSVEDEGEPQRIVTFAGGELPFTAAILIDSSASMHGEKLAAAVAGARAFLDRLRPLDQAQLTVFSDRLEILTPVGAGREVMLSGLGWARAQGGTAVADHLWAALRLLETRQGRRVVVLLSDGLDTHSVLPMAAVLEAVRQSRALVYWIRPEAAGEAGAGSVSSAWRDVAGYLEARSLLEQAVTESGGRVVPVRSAAEVEPVLLEVLAELREQYMLGYYPTVRRQDGSWRRVRVRVAEPGLEVRTARGYVDG